MNRRVVWTLWAIVLIVSVFAMTLKAVFGAEGTGSALGVQIALLTYATVGAVVLSRRPRHSIGWIYLLGASAGTIGALANAWVEIDRRTPGSSPLDAAAWVLDAVGFAVPLVTIVALPLLLFPDGTVLTRRWRPVLWTTVAGIALIACSWTFRPGFLDEARTRTNPLGIPGSKSVLQGFNGIGLVLVGFSVVAAIVSLFVRFRRASGEQRQQLKWLAWAGVWTIVLLFCSGPGYYGGILPPFVRTLMGPIVVHLFGIALALIPLAVAIAILRYRLWDIDRIVSRTVTYAVVTAFLAGLYALLAVVLPSMVLGSRETPDWVVAVATLVAAGAFVPVRQRVQDTIDRRFNRTRYDAAQTIDAFTARMREHIDLDALAVELEAVVDRTVHPAHLFLWVPRNVKPSRL